MNAVRKHGRLFGKTVLFLFALSLAWVWCFRGRAVAQPYGAPDRDEPGDAMIQEYLQVAAEKVEGDFLKDVKSAEDWNHALPRLRAEYFDMLGLWPLPERTLLKATVTRTMDQRDYIVEMVHYQSRPGLYVTGNLYRPAGQRNAERLPAVLYVCGHSPRPRNGNKTAYQSQGIWFARHGYVCLVLDTLEMGEITCTHHGTYRDGRWWWLSRGYTPAAVECWNGVRGIDYLVSLPYVDPERIAVTGISGGGAATVWISAADERVKVAVPVSGWSDLLAHVPNRVVNGHCDCMFHYNFNEWPFAQVLGMVAPRPLLFINSDADAIFPMDGNERIINRLERLYSLFGAGERVDSVVSVGGHAYRADIRQAAFRFINTYLKSDCRPVTDSEVDLVTSQPIDVHPISPEKLRVFAEDKDLPADSINNHVDSEFVPMAKTALPRLAEFASWRGNSLHRLRQLSFHHFPESIPAGVAADTGGQVRLATEPGIRIRIKNVQQPTGTPRRVWLYLTATGVDEPVPGWLKELAVAQDSIYMCEPRGTGENRWTSKNPPNYVERAHYLVGRTVDSGRVWDVAAAAGYLHMQHPEVYVAGEGAAAVLATYAALLQPEIAGLALSRPTPSHLDAGAPALLGVLRVMDVPQAIAMLVPRPVTLVGAGEALAEPVGAVYRAQGVWGNFQSK